MSLLVALLETVLESTLVAGLALGESNSATERPGKSLVANTKNADVLHAASLTCACAILGNLDLHSVVGVGSDGQAGDTGSWDITDDSGGLEFLGVLATRLAVNGGSRGPSAILVDLDG